MRVIITGAAGFIGSHLTDYLLAQEHEVVGLDNLVTGALHNLDHLQNHPRFRFLRHDVCEPLKIDGPIDRIFHLASPASPQAYAVHRIATMKVNSQGTWNLLELALEKNARFLMASSSGIYGDLQTAPQREDTPGQVNPVGLRSVYDEAKRFAETCAMAYHRERGADTRIVRVFNTYGPRMSFSEGRAIPNFIRQALANEPLTVYGDGTQARSLCYVSDMVRGIGLAMESDFHEPINLGNPEEVSMVQLARDILRLLPQSQSKIHFEPGLAYDPRLRRPDVSRARQILGWTPQMPRSEGLAKVIEWYRETAAPN